MQSVLCKKRCTLACHLSYESLVLSCGSNGPCKRGLTVSQRARMLLQWVGKPWHLEVLVQAQSQVRYHVLSCWPPRRTSCCATSQWPAACQWSMPSCCKIHTLAKDAGVSSSCSSIHDPMQCCNVQFSRVLLHLKEPVQKHVLTKSCTTIP